MSQFKTMSLKEAIAHAKILIKGAEFVQLIMSYSDGLEGMRRGDEPCYYVESNESGFIRRWESVLYEWHNGKLQKLK